MIVSLILVPQCIDLMMVGTLLLPFFSLYVFISWGLLVISYDEYIFVSRGAFDNIDGTFVF